MKKLLLSLGAIASVATPVAAVVACGAPSKPAPVPLDATKVEGMVPLLKIAVKTAITGMASQGSTDGSAPANAKAQGAPATDADGVVEQDVNFLVTMHISIVKGHLQEVQIVVSPDGELISANAIDSNGATPIPETVLDSVKETIKSGTVPQGQNTEDKEDYDSSKYDQAVIANQGVVVPTAIPDGATQAQIKLFNAQFDAFGPAYQQAVADETAKAIKAIVELEVTKEAFKTHAVGETSNSVLLTVKIMNDLGFKTSDIDTLERLIKDGAIIKVHKSDPDDLLYTEITVNGHESNPSQPAIVSSDITTWGTKTIS